MVTTVLGAVAMGFVVCLHVPTLPQYWLLDCGVPWFFFASGYWYAQSTWPYAANVRVRVRSLLVPYYLWNLLWFPVLFICNWIGWRYCGANRVVDGSWECVVRCLGFSPFAWPALVPTWFLRALFVVVVLVGGMEKSLEWVLKGGNRAVWRRGVVCLVCWGVCWADWMWGSKEGLWRGFFSFGLPLLGCACFATGMMISSIVGPDRGLVDSGGRWKLLCQRIRRHMMPVYLIHVIIIIGFGWVAKALHRFDVLETTAGDVAMWFAGIGGSMIVGELMRRLFPRASAVLFGGR